MYFIQPRSNTSSRTASRSNSRSNSYKSSPSSRSNSYNANVSPHSDAYYSNAYHHANEYTPRSNTFPSRSRRRTLSRDSSHSLDSSFSVPSICHDRYRDSYLPPRPPSPPLYEHHHQPIPTGLMVRYKIAKALRLIPERRRGGKQTTVLRPQAPYEQPYARREAWRSRGW